MLINKSMTNLSTRKLKSENLNLAVCLNECYSFNQRLVHLRSIMFSAGIMRL